MERSGGPDKIPTRDRRLKQLKFLIKDGLEKEKSLETPRIVLQVSRRVHLVELIAKYTEEIEAEKAALKKRQRPSVKERFTDLLFPHTIKYKSKKAKIRVGILGTRSHDLEAYSHQWVSELMAYGPQPPKIKGAQKSIYKANIQVHYHNTVLIGFPPFLIRHLHRPGI